MAKTTFQRPGKAMHLSSARTRIRRLDQCTGIGSSDALRARLRTASNRELYDHGQVATENWAGR